MSTRLFLFAIVVLIVSFSYSRLIEKRHQISDYGGSIAAEIGILMWFAFTVGYLIKS